MNLHPVLQPGFAGAHLLSLAVLMGIAARFRSKRWASALSLIVMITSGAIVLGLAVPMLMLLTAGHVPDMIIAPAALALPFAAGVAAYLFVFILAWVLRPRPLQFSAIILCGGVLGAAAFNSLFLAVPTVAAPSVTIYVRTADSNPVSGATLIYKTKFEPKPLSAVSDAEGRIVLHPKFGDTIEGEFAPSAGYGQVKLYIAPPGKGYPHWGIQRHWAVPFGGEKLAYPSFCLTDFDNKREHAFSVYLPPPDHAVVLPYAGLSNLATQLREAQRTGKMFNATVHVHNLESYRQLAEAAKVYDPHSPVRAYTQLTFVEFESTHDHLEFILKGLCDGKLEATIRDRGLTEMLSILQVPFSDSLSWQEKRELLQARLNSDLATIKNVPRDAIQGVPK